VGHPRRVREWLRRYLPAEVFGTISALLGSCVAERVSGSPVAVALAGSVGESIGYYATVGLRDGRRHYRGLPAGGRLPRAVARTVRDLLIEYGPAELLDSLLVRPALMAAGPWLTGGLFSGILLGKVAADVVFYAVAIPGYELRKRIFGRAA
jgi:hypothetical protein